MKVHATIETPTDRFMVVETFAPATGVFNIGDRVVLRTVRVPQGVIYKNARTKGAVQLASCEISKGSRSAAPLYYGVLKAAIAALPGYAQSKEGVPSTPSSPSPKLPETPRRPVFNFRSAHEQ